MDKNQLKKTNMKKTKKTMTNIKKNKKRKMFKKVKENTRTKEKAMTMKW